MNTLALLHPPDDNEKNSIAAIADHHARTGLVQADEDSQKVYAPFFSKLQSDFEYQKNIILSKTRTQVGAATIEQRYHLERRTALEAWKPPALPHNNTQEYFNTFDQHDQASKNEIAKTNCTDDLKKGELHINALVEEAEASVLGLKAGVKCRAAIYLWGLSRYMGKNILRLTPDVPALFTFAESEDELVKLRELASMQPRKALDTTRHQALSQLPSIAQNANGAPASEPMKPKPPATDRRYPW